MDSELNSLTLESNIDDMQRAFIGLGSNLQDPVSQVVRAIAELPNIPFTRFLAASSLYRSTPLSGDGVPEGQPDYINAVAALETRLSAPQLLSALKSIEDQHGRQRDGTRWAPRTLDLDLLLYGQEIINDDELTIPHPGLVARNFVLYPLAEIAHDLVIPGHGPLVDMIAGVSQAGLQRLT